ncbi:DMT family transporter [Acinetobacter pseudolwoffii]|uniref:EamA family transporter n=1 Tax=Acinetobacter pseudolwoffii TaxID=2053287 RepID=A0A2H9UKI4_9GAMM|nr:DMT family transporter [Acinetobacter pseudolwoffii]PJI32211.1 EamA family transporter [Acinetobacter pseudolwoffii]
MKQRQALDAKASAIMFVLCMLWGLQQVVLKWAASDISVLMQIALRSALSAIMVYPLIQQSVRRQLLSTRYLPAGLLVGILFATEFYLIGEALRYTSASHTIVLLYTAPIFVALGLHWKLPAERLSRVQWGGIFVAFSGIAVSFLLRPQTSSTLQTDALWGDFLALLGGIFWAATTVSVRLSRLAEAPATQTLFYQLLMGGILLLPLAFFSGQATIQWTTLSISSLIFHTMLISFASYLIWFWMLKHYLASRLGVFSFLTPVFGMLFGVLILDEQIELNFIVGTCMVMLGVILVSLQGWLKKPNTTNNPQEQT